MLTLVALVIFVTLLYIVMYDPLPGKIWGGHDYPEIQQVQEEIHEYSGINHDYYMEYYTYMDMAKKTNSNEYFEKAIDNLRNVALMVKEPDSEVPEEINRLADLLHEKWLKR